MSLAISKSDSQNNKEIFEQLAKLADAGAIPQAAAVAKALQEGEIQNQALTILYHPIYSDTTKSLRFRTLAHADTLITTTSDHSGGFLANEKVLKDLFFRGVHDLSFYCRSEEEFLITYSTTREHEWLEETFKLDRLCRAAFGESYVDETDLRNEAYHFWIPNLSGNRVLCSRDNYGTKFHAETDYYHGLVKIVDGSDKTCVMKTFQACSAEQISSVLKKLFYEKSWTFESSAKFFREVDRSDIQIVKINSPHISFAVFHTARSGTWRNTKEVILKIDGVWKKFTSTIVPESEHDHCEDASGNKLPCFTIQGKVRGCSRVALEHRDAVKSWPWSVSFDLGDKTRLNLTSNPPHLLYQGKTFSVEPPYKFWGWDRDFQRGIGLQEHIQRREGRDYKRGDQFSAISPVLFTTEETESMKKVAVEMLSSLGRLSSPLVRQVVDYWHPEAMTLPKDA